MKANEAPEKLHVDANDNPDDTWFCAFTTPSSKGEDIEYVRKDAFIEKACEWLNKHAKKYYFNKNGHYLGTDELVEDFKLSMEL